MTLRSIQPSAGHHRYLTGLSPPDNRERHAKVLHAAIRSERWAGDSRQATYLQQAPSTIQLLLVPQVGQPLLVGIVHALHAIERAIRHGAGVLRSEAQLENGLLGSFPLEDLQI